MCGHVPAGCVLLYHVGVRSLCFPQSVSARVGGGPIKQLFGMFIVNNIILYNIQL